MKKIAIIAAAVSALSVPAYADGFGAGVTKAQKVTATEVCETRGASVAGASLNGAGQLVVTCGRPTATGQTGAGSEAGGGLFVAGALSATTVAVVLTTIVLGAVAAGGSSSTVNTVP